MDRQGLVSFPMSVHPLRKCNRETVCGQPGALNSKTHDGTVVPLSTGVVTVERPEFCLV